MESHAPERVRRLIAGFPRERTWLLPALQAVQEALGWLSLEALEVVAEHLRVPKSEVYGVATHYPEFRLTQPGAHLIRVCAGVSCRLTGGLDCLRTLEARYGIKMGETTPDGRVTLEEADCFFICSVAPLVEVDGACHGRVTPGEVARIPVWFRSSRASHGGAISRPSPPIQLPGESARARLAHLVEQARQRAGERPRLRLLVQAGSCGVAVGAEEVVKALRTLVAMRGIEAEVVAGACNGMCWGAVAVEVLRDDWPRLTLMRVSKDGVPDLLHRLFATDAPLNGLDGVVWADEPWRGLPPAGEHPFFRSQHRILLERSGVLDPEELDDALLHGAYATLATVLDGVPPEEVIARVKAAGLQGRGGAYFPAAIKWEGCRRASGAPKYVVVNAEEGEPGIFKDRHLMEADPHRLLEGLLLAVYGAGAGRAILYIHGEAHLSARRMARAVEQALAAGLLGERVLGTDFVLEVEVRRGAGGFILGEETALLESIEGQRAMPRPRPPFPVEAGLWGKPTVINNVETLMAVPAICARGGAWFAALGGERAKGTKLFGLSGPVNRPGLVEVELGVTLRRLIEEIGGGLRGGQRLKAIVVGGPSGVVVPPAFLDTPMEPRGALSPGTGGVVAVPEGASIPEVVETLLGFNSRESCGKCTPCREGAPRLLALLKEPGEGDGEAWLARVRELAEVVAVASLCGLGQAAPAAVLSALTHFEAEFRASG